jgi:hypothetical protein
MPAWEVACAATYLLGSAVFTADGILYVSECALPHQQYSPHYCIGIGVDWGIASYDKRLRSGYICNSPRCRAAGVASLLHHATSHMQRLTD